jgi:hypothetical protein
VNNSTVPRGATHTRAEASHAFFPSRQQDYGARPLHAQIDDRTLDIANRLRFVCAEMPPDELLALARRMAAVELKYLGYAAVEHER